MLSGTLSILALALSLSGCAGELELQHVSGRSSAVLSAYRTSVREFAAGQNALNHANASRLLQLGQMREMRRAEIATRVASWRLGGDEVALRRFTVAGEAAAEQVLANAGPPPAPAKVPALAYDSGEVDAVIKQLVELQKPVTAAQRLKDLLAYGTALRDDYRAAIDKAKGDTAEAEGATKAAAKEEEIVQAKVTPQ